MAYHMTQIPAILCDLKPFKFLTPISPEI